MLKEGPAEQNRGGGGAERGGPGGRRDAAGGEREDDGQGGGRDAAAVGEVEEQQLGREHGAAEDHRGLLIRWCAERDEQADSDDQAERGGEGPRVPGGADQRLRNRR